MPLPTKCRFRSFTIKGFDLTQHLNRLRVYETILKPYLTAKATIIDNANILENLGLVGGEEIQFVIDAGDNRIYEQKMNLLAVKGEKSTQNLRTIIYEIDMIGDTYFNDKKSLVQQSFKGIPGTQAIQILHSTYLGGALEILSQSMGPISLQSYIVSAKKPMTAINDIAKRLNYGQHNSGNTLYFRDAKQHVLGPLEALFSRLSSQQEFIQEATWGKDWYDIIRAQNAIISAAAEVDVSKNGRGGMQDVSSVATQEKKVFDFRLKEVVVDKMASKIPGAAKSLLAPILGGGGSHGGVPNYSTMDSSHLPKQTDPSNKTEAERLYSAMTRNGPMITVKVPIQSGILCTVGKGCTLKLLPAMGDANIIQNSMSGLYLIMNLCHDCKADDRMVNATTTMECAKGA